MAVHYVANTDEEFYYTLPITVSVDATVLASMGGYAGNRFVIGAEMYDNGAKVKVGIRSTDSYDMGYTTHIDYLAIYKT